jgi:hypothetical protein
MRVKFVELRSFAWRSRRVGSRTEDLGEVLVLQCWDWRCCQGTGCVATATESFLSLYLLSGGRLLDLYTHWDCCHGLRRSYRGSILPLVPPLCCERSSNGFYFEVTVARSTCSEPLTRSFVPLICESYS